MSSFQFIRPLGWQAAQSSDEDEDGSSSASSVSASSTGSSSSGSALSSAETELSSDGKSSDGKSTSESSDSGEKRSEKKKKKKPKSAKKLKKRRISNRERDEVKKIQNWPGGEFKGDNEKHSPRDLFKLWADWSENFKNVLKLKDIQNQENRLGLLLIYGGPMIRKVYETAKLAIGGKKKSGGSKSFDKAWKIIDGHFRGLGSDDQERNTLQQMKMKEDEKFQDWLLRLNEQLNLCNFTEKRREEELRYAVIYRSIEKISEELEIGSAESRSVHSLIQQAIVIDRRLSRKREEDMVKKEPIDVLAISFSGQKRKNFGEGDDSEDKLKTNDWKRGKWEQPSSSRRYGEGGSQMNRPSDRLCSQCGYEDHSRDVCPARGKKCRRCNFTGHFEKTCRMTLRRDIPRGNDPKVKNDDKI